MAARVGCGFNYAMLALALGAAAVGTAGDSSPDLGMAAASQAAARESCESDTGGSGFPRALTFRAFRSASDAHLNLPFDGAVVDINGIEGGLELKRLDPGKLVLVQTNDGEGLADPDRITVGYAWLPRNPGSPWRPEDFFPGHWLYYTGSLVTETVAAEVGPTVLHVDDVGRFRTDDDVAIVGLFPDDTLDWGQYEEVRVESINSVGGFLVVQRGRAGTLPRAFAGGRARTFIHAAEWYSIYPDKRIWKPNMARMAPAAPTGLQAADVLAGFWAEKYASEMCGLDGLCFDMVPFWAPASQQDGRVLDGNLDGTGDWCIDGNGTNSYGLGVLDFFRELRRRLGPDVIVISDNSSAVGQQRAFKYLNGVEDEHYGSGDRQLTPALERTLPGLSADLDRAFLWANAAGAFPATSYLFTKDTTEAFSNCASDPSCCAYDPPGSNSRFRIGVASALLAGVNHTYVPAGKGSDPFRCSPFSFPPVGLSPWVLDEYFAGQDQRSHFLGEALGVPERILSGLGADEMISNGDFEQDVSGWIRAFQPPAVVSELGIGAPGSGAPKGANALAMQVFAAAVPPASSDVQVLSPWFNVTSSEEVSVRFFAWAQSPFELADPDYEDVPRAMTVSLMPGNLGDCDRAEMVSHTVYVGPSWREHYLVFRSCSPSSTKARLVFQIGTEAGMVYLDDISARKGNADRFVRLFEGGAVLLNGSPVSAFEFDLSALGLSGYRRLRGTVDPVVNDGSAVDGTLVVPPSDALILRLIPTLTAGFTWAPDLPTDGTPVTFTASAEGGTPPYTFTWDLGGTAASGSVVAKSFAPGSHTIALTAHDAENAVAEISQPLVVGHSESSRLVRDPASPTGYYFYFAKVAGATGYNLYEGTLGVWYDHGTGARCDVAFTDLGTGELRTAIVPAGKDAYFVVTAHDETVETPSGYASSGTERDPAQNTCQP